MSGGLKPTYNFPPRFGDNLLEKLLGVRVGWFWQQEKVEVLGYKSRHMQTASCSSSAESKPFCGSRVPVLCVIYVRFPKSEASEHHHLLYIAAVRIWDGAPFLLLIETPPPFGHSLRFLHILHRNCLLILSPSRFAVCGHHLSPRIAIVFSLLTSLPNSSMSYL